MSNLSYIYLEMGKIDSAILFGKAAVETKPYLPKPYLAVAQAYQKEHQLDSAVSVLENGLRSCDGDFLEGELLLAETFSALGTTDSAERHYRAVLNHRPRSEQPSYEPEINFGEGDVVGKGKDRLEGVALFGLGHVWAARKSLDSAAFYFRRATLKRTDYGDAWADLGIALMQMRKYSQADTAFTTALTLKPSSYLYWYNYGTLLGMSGRLADAQQAFERSLTLHPGFEPARRSMTITSELMKRMNRSPAR
jgi:tetratricopeptide (TPR) repeat protein